MDNLKTYEYCILLPVVHIMFALEDKVEITDKPLIHAVNIIFGEVNIQKCNFKMF